MNHKSIPDELREILDGVYTPEGVQVWWTHRHNFLGQAPCDAWAERKDEVLQVAQMLRDGAFS